MRLEASIIYSADLQLKENQLQSSCLSERWVDLFMPEEMPRLSQKEVILAHLALIVICALSIYLASKPLSPLFFATHAFVTTGTPVYIAPSVLPPAETLLSSGFAGSCFGLTIICTKELYESITQYDPINSSERVVKLAIETLSSPIILPLFLLDRIIDQVRSLRSV